MRLAERFGCTTGTASTGREAIEEARIAVFNERFKELTEDERLIHFSATVLVTVAIALITNWQSNDAAAWKFEKVNRGPHFAPHEHANDTRASRIGCKTNERDALGVPLATAVLAGVLKYEILRDEPVRRTDTNA